jgi:hypothetical protein
MKYATDEEESALLWSDEFREGLGKSIEEATWGKGLPKVYMNSKRQIVRHWKDGRIEVVKQL